MKVITAITSLPTAFILFSLIPKIASLPGLQQWKQADDQLVGLNCRQNWLQNMQVVVLSSSPTGLMPTKAVN